LNLKNFKEAYSVMTGASAFECEKHKDIIQIGLNVIQFLHNTPETRTKGKAEKEI